MPSQATPDGHSSRVLGMWLSDWSKAKTWSVGSWVSSWRFGQNSRTDWPLHLSPESLLLAACEDVASSDMALTWAVSLSLALMVAKTAKLFILKLRVDAAISDNNCLFSLSISANLIGWSALNPLVKPAKPCVGGFVLCSWGHSH